LVNVANGLRMTTSAAPDSTDSTASSNSYFPIGWSEHVLRKKYTDPMKLKESLDDIYGEGKYRVMEKGGRWILGLSNPMSQEELKEIEKRIYNHY